MQWTCGQQAACLQSCCCASPGSLATVIWTSWIASLRWACLLPVSRDKSTFNRWRLPASSSSSMMMPATGCTVAQHIPEWHSLCFGVQAAPSAQVCGDNLVLNTTAPLPGEPSCRCWVCQHLRHGQGTLICHTGLTSSQHRVSHCSKCSSRYVYHSAGAVLATHVAAACCVR